MKKKDEAKRRGRLCRMYSMDVCEYVPECMSAKQTVKRDPHSSKPFVCSHQ